jgi:hypothetical protein
VFIGAVIISRIATTLFGYVTTSFNIVHTCYYYFRVLHFISDVSIYTSLAFFLRGIEAAGACAYFICGYVIIFTTFLDDAGVIRVKYLINCDFKEYLSFILCRDFWRLPLK